MGMMYTLKCKNCQFEATLGSQQPYYVMTGSIVDKYCAKTGKIIRVFTSCYKDTTEISCLKKNWQMESGDPAHCRNCKGECLQDLEMLSASDDSECNGYKCPSCGSVLDSTCITSFMHAD